mgnify:CR=1 FL=1
MAANIDIGEAHDIHPKNKQEVARRLAVISLADTYGQKIPAQAPVYDNYTVENGKVRISFTILLSANASNKTKTSKASPLPGPTMCSTPPRLYGRRRSGGLLTLCQSAGSRPLRMGRQSGVYPAYTTNLPAAPFRTDNW